MPNKTFVDEPEVADVQTNDALPMMRAGDNVFIRGENLLDVIVGLVNTALVGKLKIDRSVTGLTGGTPADLDAVATTTLSYGFLFVTVIDDRLRAFSFDNDAASGDDVEPLDNPGKRWRSVL